MDDRFQALRMRQTELRDRIAARVDGVPNLRDYGLDRRDEFEAAVTAYHAETTALTEEMNEVVRERIALRNTVTRK